MKVRNGYSHSSISKDDDNNNNKDQNNNNHHKGKESLSQLLPSQRKNMGRGSASTSTTPTTPLMNQELDPSSRDISRPHHHEHRIKNKNGNNALITNGNGVARPSISDSSSSSSWSLGSNGDSDTVDASRPYGMDDVDQQTKQLTQKETRGVQTWKLFTLITIFVTAVVVSAGTWYSLDQKEINDFKESYGLFTQAIDDRIKVHVRDLFESMENMAQHVTRQAEIDQSSFPFVTVPEFELLGMQARELSGLEDVMWVPRIMPETLDAWNNYSLQNAGWLNESRLMYLHETNKTWDEVGYIGAAINVVYDLNVSHNGVFPVTTSAPWEPVWQISPPPFGSWVINYNMYGFQSLEEVEAAATKLERCLLGPVIDYSLSGGNTISEKDHEAFHERLVEADDYKDPNVTSYRHPHAMAVQPIYQTLTSKDTVVGHVIGTMTLDAYVVGLLPDGVKRVSAVLKNSCGQVYTYELIGDRAYYKGEGDFHETIYDDMVKVIPFYDEDVADVGREIEGHCLYEFLVYPLPEFEEQYRSKIPVATGIILAAAFVFLTAVFFVYDFFVHQRNEKMLKEMIKTNAVVSSLFPSNVRDRLFAEVAAQKNQEHANGKNRLKSYLAGGDAALNKDDDDDDRYMYKTKPIADLFPDTTVLFADLAGFTAWSSMREPTQVFILLETIYKAMDEIAKTRRVFKVETVGDCYVAVTGLPDPRKDHAVSMVRFAVDCLHRMHVLTKKLEVLLGPDTTDLDMRVGIHSGPVTAGVLRGERSRFQLFGDTMNTASRMESNGIPGKIHLSQETTDLLIAAGKQHWVTPREDKIVAKGKGELQTYWLITTKSSANTRSEAGTESESNEAGVQRIHVDEMVHQIPTLDEKTDRLVQWNVEVLLTLLKKVVAQRGPAFARRDSISKYNNKVTTTPLEEVVEIISLPTFDRNRFLNTADVEEINLGRAVSDQLKEYVSAVASMYRQNPFHNFEHASHVTMSVVKLLSRIVAPDVDAINNDMESALHNYTYGITSDPLTQFACVFSALIHDVDHSGVPNTQLVIENPQLAKFYKNKSVAEQNSVDLSWDLLQDNTFADLRHAIHPTEAERTRFRQLVVNSVMATDIMDKDLKALRNGRWEKAFSGANTEESSKDATDRKATIVIEHLIQASDVAHTMQHWHIYRKWNQRLFEEMYSSYMDGRAEKDPAESWYKGEIGFFDFYIIPLAKKLKDCGVFGVSSDEYLNYAEKNRKEWEQRGEEVVASLVEVVHKKYGRKGVVAGGEAAAAPS